MCLSYSYFLSLLPDTLHVGCVCDPSLHEQETHVSHSDKLLTYDGYDRVNVLFSRGMYTEVFI